MSEPIMLIRQESQENRELRAIERAWHKGKSYLMEWNKGSRGLDMEWIPMVLETSL